ncbi:MAG TPA: electron transfer flavoprotein subunit beta/FixA family protein, partial [Pseudomonadota bacterium]|nr:electron transfer flavoprotein subunit beta/FixA family protein [Pseudomonadota bacterium]
DYEIIEAKDEELDASVVAKALAKIVQRDQPDLVLMGKLAADNEGNDVGQRLAAILGWPQATFACSIQVTDGGKAVIVGREVDAGVELKKVRLPAVVTVDLRIVSPHAVKNGRTAPTFAYAEGPRYATLKGIRAAKDKPLEQLQLAQLGVAPGAKTKVLKVEMPPARQAGKKVGSVAELVEKLNKEAKVI